MELLVGNIFALIGSILMIYAGYLKEKKKILLVQIAEISMFIVSNLVLGGITGAIMNLVSLIGNILGYFDKLGTKEKSILSICSLGLTYYYNNFGWIGWLPFICVVMYLWQMTLKNIVQFKMLIIVIMILWIIYDYSIRSFASIPFDVLTVVSNVVAAIQVSIEKKKQKSE